MTSEKQKNPQIVIPAKAGIQGYPIVLNHGNRFSPMGRQMTKLSGHDKVRHL